MTREKLESVYYLRKEKNMWEARYEELTADIAPPIKNIDGMPYSQTFNISNPTEEKAMRLHEAAYNIECMMEEIESAIWEIEDFILRQQDTLIRQILKYRCIDNLKWREVAKLIGGSSSEDSIRQIYHRFISDMENN